MKNNIITWLVALIPLFGIAQYDSSHELQLDSHSIYTPEDSIDKIEIIKDTLFVYKSRWDTDNFYLRYNIETKSMKTRYRDVYRIINGEIKYVKTEIPRVVEKKVEVIKYVEEW